MPLAAASASANWSWTFEPGALVLLAALTWAYAARWRALAGQPGARRMSPWRAVSYGAGVLVIAAALISPIDALADQLFAIHMVQHVLLLDVAPVLMMLGLTKGLLRPVTRRMQRIERAAGPLAHPVFAVVAYVAIMWVWHVPALYDAALEHPVIHVLEHVCFLSVGLLYWWHLLSPIRSRMAAGPFGPVVYMLVTKLFVGLLGIGITFAPDPLYAFYEHAPRLWGLSALDDQAAAGAIMAIEQSIVMGVALTYLFVRALGESEREEQRAERYGAA
jgi:putative membrane protein